MIRTRLCDLLGITHPIVNAPMTGPAAILRTRLTHLLRA